MLILNYGKCLKGILTGIKCRRMSKNVDIP